MRHLDDFGPADHPLRVIRVMVNKALTHMDELFARMYAADIKGGRPSIAPEKLLRAMLIQAHALPDELGATWPVEYSELALAVQMSAM